MKKLLLVICALFFWGTYVEAADFVQAEELYRQGKYAAALTDYETLLKTYPNDPHLYYNIGNCYFKMNSKGLAAANYYRAFKLAPSDKDIRHNLSLALSAAGEKWVPESVPEALHKAFFSLKLNELKGLVFLLFWISALSAVFWLVKRRFGGATLVCVALLAILAGWYAWRAKINAEPLAIVAMPVAELRSGPGDNFPASANISQGMLLSVQDAKDDWLEVVVKSQGLTGWMTANAVEKI